MSEAVRCLQGFGFRRKANTISIHSARKVLALLKEILHQGTGGVPSVGKNVVSCADVEVCRRL